MLLGKSTWSFNNSKNLHFGIEKDIHTSSENYKESGYGHDLELLIILH